MTASPSLESHLSRYLPSNAVGIVAGLLVRYRVKLKVTRSRFTKLADYRPPKEGNGHLITINHDLNPYEFLLTLLHEFAHLTTHQRYGHRVFSHGEEWKKEYRLFLYPFLHQAFFPEDVLSALDRHLKKPSASSCSDEPLQRVLRKYDNGISQKMYVEDIPAGVTFRLKNGMEFSKGEKLRKRYRCKEVKTGKTYLVSGIAEVLLP